MEVLGVTSYGDLSQFAQQQSRASAFILSIDDEEFGDGTKYGQGGVSEFENRTEPLSITGVALVLTGITGTLFSFLIFQHH